MRVVRMVISFTWPCRSATRTQSPTWNGLSQKITKPGDDVGERVLGGEADGDAGHAEAGHRRPHVDSHLIGRHHQGEDEDGAMIDVVHQQADELGGEPGALQQRLDRSLGDPVQHPERAEDEQRGDQVGKELDEPGREQGQVQLLRDRMKHVPLLSSRSA